MRELMTLPAFAGVPLDEIVRLTQNLPRKNFKRGDRIIRRGQYAKEAYLLLKGKVEVFQQSEVGLRITVLYHEAPFFFGEIELFEERAYSANVKAMESCETLVVSKNNYLKILHSNHQVAVNMIHLLSNLLCEIIENRRIQLFGRTENSLANLLWYHAKLFGKKEKEGTTIQKPLNKSELATVLGISRPSIINAFKQLQKEGLVILKNKYLFIPSIEALLAKARKL